MFSNGIKKFAMPLVFLLALLFAILLGGLLPIAIKSFFYAVSLAIKECLVFMLPLVIFALVYQSFSKLGVNALKFLFLIIPLICCSNLINTFLSYLSGMSFINLGAITKIQAAQTELPALLPLFSFKFPSIISNDIALCSGVVCGIFSKLIQRTMDEKIVYFFDVFVKYFFKILIPTMPLFIIGTALKLQHDEMLSAICSKYWAIMLVFVVSAYGYVLLQFLLLSGFRFGQFAFYLKNITPAIITGFGSMSSAAALPLSLKAAEENLANKSNAAIIIPSTVNVHLVGDCFFIPMLALGILVSLGLPMPSCAQYSLFAVHFVLAKFAVAAVPGGGILVMLPILQTYLNFNGEMLGLITALYVLFDPIITACNIAGNGAMAIIFDKMTKAFNGKDSLSA
jgi:Na+/H+-dicarboxylate symporter